MFNIRPAVEQDIPIISAIYSALSINNTDRRFLQKVIDGNQSTLLIAEGSSKEDHNQETSCLGLIILQQQITPAGTYLPPLNFCYMIDLVVPSSIDNIKITKALINAGKNWASSKGAEYLEIGI